MLRWMWSTRADAKDVAEVVGGKAHLAPWDGVGADGVGLAVEEGLGALGDALVLEDHGMVTVRQTAQILSLVHLEKPLPRRLKRQKWKLKLRSLGYQRINP